MSEQLRAAAERTREHARYCDENRMDEGPYSEDATLQTMDESLLIDWAVDRLAEDESFKIGTDFILERFDQTEPALQRQIVVRLARLLYAQPKEQT